MFSPAPQNTCMRVRCLVDYTTNEYAYAEVLASCHIAGYTFLIHRDMTDKTLFTATYAPLSLQISNNCSDISAVISYLESKAHLVAEAITKQFAYRQRWYFPLLSSENGLETDDWRWRETCRFENGTYLPVPSVQGLTYPTEHYVHLSVTKTETDFVAFTPSEEYGQRDRQVRLKFGKYLHRAFPNMSDADIQSAVVSLRAKLALQDSPASLHFATDRATINELFETVKYACDSSCESCMYGKWDEQETRPYHVYANSPDVALAYVLEQGQMVSRSVVSTKDKRWVRAYSIHQSDSTACRVLTDLLEQAGYEQGDLEGNRLTNLGADCLPYLDGDSKGVLYVDRRYWKVCAEDQSYYVCDCTDGTGSSHAPQCELCGRDEDDCACIYCACCGEWYVDGCNTCSFCEECQGCTEHDGCICARCNDCNEIIAPRHTHTTACSCDRCAECNELDNKCACEKENKNAETAAS